MQPSSLSTSAHAEDCLPGSIPDADLAPHTDQEERTTSRLNSPAPAATLGTSSAIASSHGRSDCPRLSDTPTSTLMWGQPDEDAAARSEQMVLALQPAEQSIASASADNPDSPQAATFLADRLREHDALGEHVACPQIRSSPNREQQEEPLPGCPTMGTWLGLAAGGVYLSAVIPAGIAVGACMVIKELCAAVSDRVIPSTLPQPK